jgi:SAM-dependent methyltransferase
MPTPEDRLIERERFDRCASGILASDNLVGLGPDGAARVPEEIRTPYAVYEAHIRRFVRPNMAVLDVCCGDGRHSLAAATAGADVTVSDIAPHNVELTLRRAARAGLRVEGWVADAEQLPCSDVSFDLVTCAGGLSYVELDVFLREVRRVLKPGGLFVCVDSLDHNPIYRFNRYLHYLRDERTLSTLRRMPRMATIARLGAVFGRVEASYHGIFSFLCPMLQPTLGPARTARCLDALDSALPWLRRYAFKFVAIAQKSA